MLYCRKCKAKYFKDDISVCKFCGGDVVDGEDFYSKHLRFRFPIPDSAFMKALIFVTAIIVVISPLLFYSPTGAVVQKTCQEVEERYIDEVPYETDTVYSYYPKYNILGSSMTEQWSNQLGVYYNYSVTLENIDSEDYYYTVQFILDTSNHGKLSSLVKKPLKNGSADIFEAYFDTDLNEKVDGKFVVFPEPVQKTGKAIKIENRPMTRKVTKCDT